MLTATITAGKKDVPGDCIFIFQAKKDIFIGSTKGAFIMGATNGYLQDNRIGLTGRPDNIANIVHWLMVGLIYCFSRTLP